MRRVLLLAWLVGVVRLAGAVSPPPGGCLGTRICDATRCVCTAVLDVGALGLSMTPTAGASSRVTLDTNTTVPHTGACIGDATGDFCGTLGPALTGKDVDLSGSGTTLELPQNTSSGTTTEGRCWWDTTNDEQRCGTGSATAVLRPHIPVVTVGGLASTAFTYNGESSASGDVCRGGTASGSTCTWTFNSVLGRIAAESATTSNVAVVQSYSSMTVQSGTVTIGTPGVRGSPVVIRVKGDVTITGGTFNLRGKGGPGATSGTCASSSAGKAGGDNDYQKGGAAGASGNNAGTAGNAAGTPLLFPMLRYFHMLGTGGGACPVSGQIAVANIAALDVANMAGTGGGGGGCAASCSGTCGAGGAGGGSIWIEVGGTYSCSGATFDVRGNDGSTGGGSGGGGGGIRILAHAIGTDTCTYSTGGGAAGATPPTNCGAGAAGAAGTADRLVVPQ